MFLFQNRYQYSRKENNLYLITAKTPVVPRSLREDIYVVWALILIHLKWKDN